MPDTGSSAPARRDGLRRLTPLDPPMTPFMIGGLVIWAAAWIVGYAADDLPNAADRERWLGICAAGFLLGLAGLALMIRHDARRDRDS
ncbi:DUF2530 domain-containing protein [Pilimelia columellifera]|uniref:DUF2530 domain-containing protein n=1 Tax=Pilimelia columellifera subsp. columellifera TaxID=706583 RepID=A0ABN3MW95_9ACTN